jgi:hypothetical protein
MASALIPTIVTRAARSAGTAFEALAGTSARALGAAATAVRASTTIVRTTAAIVAAAITSTAAERTLETLARIAAYARGVSRKFFARSRRATGAAARRAGFAGKQDDVVFGDGADGSGGREGVGRDVAGVGRFDGFLAVSAFMVRGFGVFVFMEAESGMVLGAFVSGVGFGFGAAGGAAFFDFGGFFFGKLGDFHGFFDFDFRFRFGSVLFFFGFLFFNFLRVRFFGFFRLFVFFKNSAASNCVDDRVFLGVFLLGFHDAGSKGGDLIFAQRLGLTGNGGGGSGQFERRRFMARRIISVGGKSDVVGHANIFVGGYGSGFGFGTGIGEQPARKSAGKAARTTSGLSGRRAACGTRRFLRFG